MEEGSWQEKVELQRGGQECRGEGQGYRGKDRDVEERRDPEGRAGMHSEN